MRFWDSSALIPAVVTEAVSGNVLALFGQDPDLIVWWATPVECWSALSRRTREGAMTAEDLAAAGQDLRELLQGSVEVQPSEMLRQQAVALVTRYQLRAADALQLAAALCWGGAPLEFVSLDRRLVEAARAEGLRTLP